MTSPKNLKEPEDLGLKIPKNKEEVFWTTLKETLEEGIDQSKKQIIINLNSLILCEKQLEKAKDLNKSTG